MAKTEIQEVGATLIFRQSWLFGFRQAAVLVMQESGGVYRISPEVRGAKLNNETLETWQRASVKLGDIVSLPKGGTFKITPDVLSGKKPIIVP